MLPTGLGFLRHGHLCRFLVRIPYLLFHGPQVDRIYTVSPFTRFVPLRLPRTLTIRPGESPAPATPRRQRSLYGSTEILISSPFVMLELRHHLGPANPQLTNIAEEPLSVRPSRFSPDYRCYYGQDFRHQSVHTNSRPCFHPIGAPTYRNTL